MTEPLLVAVGLLHILVGLIDPLLLLLPVYFDVGLHLDTSSGAYRRTTGAQAATLFL